MYNYDSSPTIRNCSFTSNLTSTATTKEGAGMKNDYFSSPSLINCTITSNSAQYGGGMYNYWNSSPTLTNCIIWGNSASVNGNDFYVWNGTTTVTYCCYIKNADNVYNIGATSFTQTDPNIHADPEFVGAENNPDHPYSIGGISPCCDVGNNSANSETYDLRGADFSRKLNKTTGDEGTIDIGAYEYKVGTDASLPVELCCFSAANQSGGVLLSWSTESEVENLGFIIGKRRTENGKWEEIASYLTDGELEGQGSTTEKHEYQYTDKAVQPGMTYGYRLADVDYSGTVTWHPSVEIQVRAEDVKFPTEFGLQNIYPNPFNPSTTIAYQLPEAEFVTVTIYNTTGKLISTLVHEQKAAGSYQVDWEPQALASGIYLVRIQAGAFATVRKCMMMK